MRILLKCPTRSRPQRVIQTLKKYIDLASRPQDIGVAVSCDTDDATMTDPRVWNTLELYLGRCEWKKIFFSDNKSKIEACNANMNEIDYPWDIVVLVSDDMIPQIEGYDDVIRRHMKHSFPNTDGILWFNDGTQGINLNTLTIMGRKMYESFGFLYQPCYKSLFCDTELTDLCKTTLKDKTLYLPTVIIRHVHPQTGFPETNDALYMMNQRHFTADRMTYIQRKKYEYDWSVLIPSLVERKNMLEGLLASIREKVQRICPEMRVEYCLDVDNRQTSIGAKRERLLQNAKGKYTSFIDDDDNITDAYIEDLWACIQGGYQVMRIYGEMGDHRFMHSAAIGLQDKMVSGNPPLFQRPPNHLNPILADIAKFSHFKDATYGEDLEWTISLAKQGFLHNQYTSHDSRTQYIYNVKQRTVHPQTIEFQRKSTLEQMLPYLFTPTGGQPEKRLERSTSGLRLTSRGFVSK
jgi:virulence-associated protein VapD